MGRVPLSTPNIEKHYADLAGETHERGTDSRSKLQLKLELTIS